MNEEETELAMPPEGERFADRRAGGAALAAALGVFAGRDDTVVLALPRGGVPVAYEIARALDAPLDVCCVQRFGAPGYPEYAMGAVASGGASVLNRDVIIYLKVPADVVSAAVESATEALRERERTFRPNDATALDVAGRTVLLVDDGLCTGATLRAAARALRTRQAARIVACVPVAWALSRDDVLQDVDDVVSVRWPETLGTVGRWYLNFDQLTDEEVRALLTDVRPPAS